MKGWEELIGDSRKDAERRWGKRSVIDRIGKRARKRR